jgi:hypothetical protein
VRTVVRKSDLALVIVISSSSRDPANGPDRQAIKACPDMS